MRSDDMPTFVYRGERELDQPHERREFVTVNDVGFVDDDGYLHLSGRADDIAVISGVNVNARSTHEALLELNYVSDALVEVVNDVGRSDAIRASIVLKDEVTGITASRIRTDLRRVLPGLGIPRDIAFVNELPSYDSGKTVTRYLELKGVPVDRFEDLQSFNIDYRFQLPPTFPSGITVIEKPITESTNTDAVELAKNNPNDLTLIWAHEQTSGRGRLGRKWKSLEGNVFWTMLVRLDLANSDIHGIVFVAALAAHSAVRSYTPLARDVKLKWPNDTLIDGRKCSGILIETSGIQGARYAAVGIGINVARHPIIGVMYPSTSLRAEGSAAHRNDVLTTLTAAFTKYLDRWRQAGFPALRDHYLTIMHGLNEPITVSLSADKSQKIYGINRGVDPNGFLLVETQPGSIRSIYAGDVILERAPGPRQQA